MSKVRFEVTLHDTNSKTQCNEFYLGQKIFAQIKCYGLNVGYHKIIAYWIDPDKNTRSITQINVHKRKNTNVPSIALIWFKIDPGTTAKMFGLGTTKYLGNWRIEIKYNLIKVGSKTFYLGQ